VFETGALETEAFETGAFETEAFGTIEFEAISFRVALLLDALSIALVRSECFLLVDLGVSEPRRPTRSTRVSSRRSFCWINGILQSPHSFDDGSLVVPQLMQIIDALVLSARLSFDSRTWRLDRVVPILVPHSWQKRSPGTTTEAHPGQVATCSEVLQAISVCEPLTSCMSNRYPLLSSKNEDDASLSLSQENSEIVRTSYISSCAVLI